MSNKGRWNTQLVMVDQLAIMLQDFRTNKNGDWWWFIANSCWFSLGIENQQQAGRIVGNEQEGLIWMHHGVPKKWLPRNEPAFLTIFEGPSAKQEQWLHHLSPHFGPAQPCAVDHGPKLRQTPRSVTHLPHGSRWPLLRWASCSSRSCRGARPAERLGLDHDREIDATRSTVDKMDHDQQWKDIQRQELCQPAESFVVPPLHWIDQRRHFCWELLYLMVLTCFN